MVKQSVKFEKLDFDQKNFIIQEVRKTMNNITQEIDKHILDMDLSQTEKFLDKLIKQRTLIKSQTSQLYLTKPKFKFPAVMNLFIEKYPVKTY